MSIGDSGGSSAVGWATARGRNWPTLRQFTVFLENRVGQLLEVVRRFDGSRVRIIATGSTTVVCVDREGRVRRLPEWLRGG